ncbi:hypothetical protein CHCC14525_3615 [Bacillus licheniformis]|nr:hypothetical protein CHCC14525_3615 [Bacillus licheniformis]
MFFSFYSFFCDIYLFKILFYQDSFKLDEDLLKTFILSFN